MSGRDTDPSDRVAAILDEESPGPVLRLPSSVAGGRYRVSRRAVVGVLLVVAVALAVLGGRFLLARQQADPEPVGTVAGEGGAAPFATDGTGGDGPAGGAEPVDGATAPAPAATAGASGGGEVTVHVAGQVREPGVVTLPADSRVADALEEAGGTSDDADLGVINLARPLVDGERVYVPAPGETPPVVAGPSAGAGAAAGGGSQPVNLNTADLTTLETLPGVGPVLAERIIDWRDEHGGFTSIDELGEVSGIGEKTFAQLESEVTV